MLSTPRSQLEHRDTQSTPSGEEQSTWQSTARNVDAFTPWTAPLAHADLAAEYVPSQGDEHTWLK